MSGRPRSTAALARSTLLVSAIRGADLGLSFLVSVLLANRFGASGALDAFFLARRTTIGFGDTLRKLVAQIVMPWVVDRTDRGAPMTVRGLPRPVLAFLLLVALLMLGGLVAPVALVGLFAPGFGAERRVLAAGMMAIMTPLLPIAVIASLLAAVLQAHRRYRLSEGTAILQRAILVAVLTFAVPPLGIVAGAWTMLAAGVLALLVLAVAARPILRAAPGGLAAAGAAAPDADAGQGGGIAAAVLMAVYFQATTLADFAVASTVREGGVAVLEYGARLVSLVPGLLMVSLNTVLYPELLRAVRDPDGEVAAAGLARFQRLGFFVQVPVSVAMIATAEPMIRVLFGHGAFGEADVLRTTAVAAGYAAAAAAMIPLNTTTAAIYADPRRSCVRDMAVIAAGGLALRGAAILWAAPRFGVAGIAWGAAIATLGTFLLAQGVAARRFRPFAPGRQLRDFARTLACGAAAEAACWSVRAAWPMPAGLFGRLALIAATGAALVAAYALAAAVLRVPELDGVRALAARRLARRATR